MEQKENHNSTDKKLYRKVLTYQNTEARIHELLYLLDTTDLGVKEYRDEVVRNFIAKVVVLNADRIRVTFKGSGEIEVELRCE